MGLFQIGPGSGGGGVTAPRPSQGGPPARTHKQVGARNLTADSTLYTVTAGKTLWVVGFSISAAATSNAAWSIYVDDGSAGLPIYFVRGGAVVATGNQSYQSIDYAGVEPRSFTVSISVHVSSGAPIYDVGFAGYEE